MSFVGVGLGAGLLSGFMQESEGELNLLCYIYCMFLLVPSFLLVVLSMQITVL